MGTEPASSPSPTEKTVFVTNRVKKSRVRQSHQLTQKKRLAMKSVMILTVLALAVVYVLVVVSVETVKMNAVASELMEFEPVNSSTSDLAHSQDQ
ncbi:hypothetical protein PF005_g9915 [Phytophthora fragariae]|uniref:Uncharacterized protein n=3 Tax=Phytophthora TaxID=4783 RepID=A0A6A3Y8Y7_9STRA|nr:hypothetical protein PF003_g4662 [Phytophthora fragariae]KAE8939460.1 hypothetical protein PF009_g10689 [Phytophthora fragariae]KAE9012972.1 hypothetical protein PF011_g8678 [Phytophthora fragariae]KAE9115681.1 hypothetical protein PF010_g9246 [Phytophthora fragariae]KAE9214219.1 hypothetical protein PF005_g9915 [Phytophthora fragariae]